MVEDTKAQNFMNSFHPTWLTCDVSVVETSRGLLVTWNPLLFDFLPFLCCGGILLKGTSLQLNL
jgi:hypothetical protein